MKNSLLLLLTLALLVSCKSEYEKIRTSTDTQLIYRTANEYFQKKQYYRAQVLYEQIINNFRGRSESENMYFNYAYTHFNLEQYVLAAHYFENFIGTYPNSERREEAEFMTAYSNYKLSPGYRLDQTYTQKAIDGLQNFIDNYPESERVDQANKLIDGLRAKLELKAFEEAKLYYDLKQFQSAIHEFKAVLVEFPDTKNAETIRYLIIKSAYNYALNSLVEKQQERYATVLGYVEDYERRYPKGAYRREVNDIQKICKANSKKLVNDRSKKQGAAS